jgi:hypothetical protein
VYFASLYLQKVPGFSIKAVLLAGLACMGAGQLWLAQITAGASYPAAVLPGLVLTAAGVGP